MRKHTKPISILRSTHILLSMASLFTIFIILFLNFHSHSSFQLHNPCKATRFPQQCQSTLPSLLPHNPTPVQIIQSTINASSQNIITAQSKVSSLADSTAAKNNRTLYVAAKSCVQVLHYSRYRTSLASQAFPHAADLKHARAWLSAAVGYQYGCWNGLKSSNHTAQVADALSFLQSLTVLSSNALSMMVSYDLFGNDTGLWRPPMTEREGFWEESLAEGFRDGPKIPEKLKADATVCKVKGEGCYETIQEAVNAAPDASVKKFVIYIKEGVYKERVRIPLRKTNVVFLGDGVGKTVITGSANVALQGSTTYNSATVGVAGDGFVAKDLTIQNTAGANAHQAVAFRSDSDLSVIENCEFIGNQDTLYAHALRQFYKSCRIIGNVDFIFGNSAAIFQECEILIQPRQGRPEKGENNAITAHGRTDPAQSTGFVFQNCMINGTEEYMALYYSNPKVHKNYLGRPWKEFSRTIFIRSYMEDLITPEGWMPWSGDFALKTLYYGEFENAGPGSNLTQRVSWSSQVPDKHVLSYSVQSFIQGDDWNFQHSF